MRYPATKPRQGGFSLLEVLLAFLLAALVLGMGLPALAQTAGRLAELRTHSAALALAQAKLETYRHDYSDPPRAYAGEQAGLQWRITVEAILPDGMAGPVIGPHGLQRVTAEVGRDPQSPPLVVLSAHRLRR